MPASCRGDKAEAMGSERRDMAMPASGDAGASVSGKKEAQTFWAVRRQRLQALTFETLPSVTRVIG